MHQRKTRPIELNGRPARPRERMFARAPGAAFDVRAAGGVTEILIYDEIGPFGVTAAAFRDRLKAAPGDVLVKINSPGGDVFDGVAMHNDLLAHAGKVRVEITGVAASAASIVAMAGDEIAIAENAFLMIHKAWGLTIGNEDDHVEAADVLAKIDKALADTYAARTGQDLETIADMMTAETWMQGEEAKANGFATELLAAADVKARFDLAIYSRVPAALKQPPNHEPTMFASCAELEHALQEHLGLARRAAKKIAAAGWPAITGVQPEIEDLAGRLAAATAELATLRSK